MVWPCLPLLPSLAFFQFPECPEFFSTEVLCMCYSRCLDCCSLSSSNVCLLLSFQLSPQMSPPQGDLLSQLWPSVQFSRSVVSDSLWPHESQHTRPPCPSPTPGVHWDSRPSSQWCHPAMGIKKKKILWLIWSVPHFSAISLSNKIIPLLLSLCFRNGMSFICDN